MFCCRLAQKAQTIQSGETSGGADFCLLTADCSACIPNIPDVEKLRVGRGGDRDLCFSRGAVQRRTYLLLGRDVFQRNFQRRAIFKRQQLLHNLRHDLFVFPSAAMGNVRSQYRRKITFLRASHNPFSVA